MIQGHPLRFRYLLKYSVNKHGSSPWNSSRTPTWFHLVIPNEKPVGIHSRISPGIPPVFFLEVAPGIPEGISPEIFYLILIFRGPFLRFSTEITVRTFSKIPPLILLGFYLGISLGILPRISPGFC